MAKILVVEDDLNMRVLLVEALEDLDYEVKGATSGMHALSLAEDEPFDLVITDVRMEGMDGIECLTRLRSVLPAARSIVMTGYADTRAPGRAIEAQAEDYLYKPFTIKQLIVSVERVLGSRKESAEYQSLLGRLAAGSRRLLDRIRASSEMAAMEKARDRAFQGLYVGIRSKVLSRRDTHHVWLHLAGLEERRERLEESEELAEVRALQEGYTYLVDLLGALQGPDQVSLFTRTRPNQVTLEQVGTLHEGVLGGSLSTEQLKLAHVVTRMPPALLEQSPEMAELRQTLWGR